MSSSSIFAAIPANLLQGPPIEGTPQTPSSPAGASGTPAGAPGARPAGGFDFVTVAIFGVLLLFIVTTILGGRRERKKMEQMIASIKKNDQVRTVGGIIGSVVEVKPDVIIMKVDENSNTKITVARGKIEAVMKESTASA